MCVCSCSCDQILLSIYFQFPISVNDFITCDSLNNNNNRKHKQVTLERRPWPDQRSCYLLRFCACRNNNQEVKCQVRAGRSVGFCGGPLNSKPWHVCRPGQEEQVPRRPQLLCCLFITGRNNQTRNGSCIDRPGFANKGYMHRRLMGGIISREMGQAQCPQPGTGRSDSLR